MEEWQLQRSRNETNEHIRKVQARIGEVQSNLYERAQQHDLSKLAEPEVSGYAVLQVRLADVEYGTPEYHAALAEAQPTIQHHYQVNDHHPEYYPNGVAGMSLMALMEMVCDWKAASERTKQGSIGRSLEVNAERFGLDPQLASIIQATIKELGW